MEAIFSWVKNIVVFFLILTLIDEILPDSDYRKYIRLAGGMVLILIVFLPVLKLFHMTDSMDYYYQWESLKTAVAGSSLIDDGFDGAAADQRKNDWILSQYEENLGAQIAALLENEGFGLDAVSVSVNEDDASEDFGQIQAITLEIYRIEDAAAAGNGGANAGVNNDATGNGAATAGNGDARAGSDNGGANVVNDNDDAKVTNGGANAEIGADVKPVTPVAPVRIDESAAVTDEPDAGSIASDEILALKKLLSGNYGVHMNQIIIHVRGR